MRKLVLGAVLVAALAAPSAADAHYREDCRYGYAVGEMSGWPLTCKQQRKLARQWLRTRSCDPAYDGGYTDCRFRLGRRWACSAEWVGDGEFRVNCWVPGLFKPHERFVDFTYFDG